MLVYCETYGIQSVIWFHQWPHLVSQLLFSFGFIIIYTHTRILVYNVILYHMYFCK